MAQKIVEDRVHSAGSHHLPFADPWTGKDENAERIVSARAIRNHLQIAIQLLAPFASVNDPTSPHLHSLMGQTYPDRTRGVSPHWLNIVE